MKNKKKILIIILALLIGVLVGTTAYFIKNKINKESEKQISKLIEKINVINNNFKQTNLDFDDYYVVGNNNCYKYTGKNTEELQNIMNDIYINPNLGNLEMDEDNNVFVCIPNYCNEIIDIKSYDIIDQSDNEKLLSINNKTNNVSYIIKKNNGSWKINYPIINCE